MLSNSASACRPHLDLLDDPEINAAWQAMKELGCGLGEENFPR